MTTRTLLLTAAFVAVTSGSMLAQTATAVPRQAPAARGAAPPAETPRPRVARAPESVLASPSTAVPE